MPLKESVYLFLVERSGEFLLPFLDKTDIEILSRVNSVWMSNIASYRMFSTLFRSIKDVVTVKQEDKAPVKTSKQPVKIDKNKIYTSTRVLPRSVLKIKQDPTPKKEEEEKKTQSKFSKRFNMCGNIPNN